MNITIFFKELLTKKTLENNSCFLFRLWAMKCGNWDVLFAEIR